MRATHAEHVFVEAPVPRSWVTAPPRAPLHYLCTRSAACRAGPSPSGSKCLLARQMRRPCAAALPAHHRPACAPEARRVVNALTERLKMPARAPDAGSCTHSHFHMRVRAADPHSHMQARSSCVLYSRFPGSPASDSRFPGRNGRHRAGIRRETWNPHRKRLSPRTQKGSTTCED